ncbi:MAG: DAK2 domain-containing protein, partial [Candidatus Dormibacteraceae bacterium]
YGLQLMLEGMLHSVQDFSPALSARLRTPVKVQAALELPEEGWGYCTEFLIIGNSLDVEQVRGEIAALGNSVLVVGDEQAVKVHVHTDEPSQVINLASRYGRLDRLNVGDMSSQHRRIREENSTPRANQIGVVVVAAGTGLAEIFRSLDVDAVVEGGQTMNPSTQDMLRAVEQIPYSEVLLLPNNKNVILAARQVVELTEKRVHVVETVTVPQGLAAVIAFGADRPLKENLAGMREAVAHIQTIELTRAVRDTNAEDLTVRRGDVIALVNDRLEHVGESFAAVAQAAMNGIGPGQYELVTIYRGEEIPESDAESLKAGLEKEYPELEVELHAGGQELYPFIISVE